jgi:Transposase
MKILLGRYAGLDVHKLEIVACLRLTEKRKVGREVRRFQTTTQGLLSLVEWLEAAGCTHVAMEATGVYWKPVWHSWKGILHSSWRTPRMLRRGPAVSVTLPTLLGLPTYSRMA